MARVFPIATICALTAGLLAQFTWKMVYFPEPIVPVIFEIAFILFLAGTSVWVIATKWETGKGKVI